jgi:hypothetical protein
MHKIPTSQGWDWEEGKSYTRQWFVASKWPGPTQTYPCPY